GSKLSQHIAALQVMRAGGVQRRQPRAERDDFGGKEDDAAVRPVEHNFPVRFQGLPPGQGPLPVPSSKAYRKFNCTPAASCLRYPKREKDNAPLTPSQGRSTTL